MQQNSYTNIVAKTFLSPTHFSNHLSIKRTIVNTAKEYIDVQSDCLRKWNPGHLNGKLLEIQT